MRGSLVELALCILGLVLIISTTAYRIGYDEGVIACEIERYETVVREGR